MKEASLYEQLEMYRYSLGIAISDVTEEEANIIPKGFNNNIRWNVGHVLVSTDAMILTMAGFPSTLPEEWGQYFMRGTSPQNFTDETPTLAELQEASQEQMRKLRALVEGKLDTPLANPFELPKTTIYTSGDGLTFCMFHEGLHMGQIQGIRKLVK
ncbi:DinB family protein [Risungbinella massiliensis]|uniref:DinB family protein n=1 Tax=Risungbinella massiliensis TaxID=1329796 RepID=UPI0005CC82EB|nr:DinB family protein [Risungbinella massiliensis]